MEIKNRTATIKRILNNPNLKGLNPSMWNMIVNIVDVLEKENKELKELLKKRDTMETKRGRSVEVKLKIKRRIRTTGEIIMKGATLSHTPIEIISREDIDENLELVKYTYEELKLLY